MQIFLSSCSHPTELLAYDFGQGFEVYYAGIHFLIRSLLIHVLILVF